MIGAQDQRSDLYGLILLRPGPASTIGDADKVGGDAAQLQESVVNDVVGRVLFGEGRSLAKRESSCGQTIQICSWLLLMAFILPEVGFRIGGENLSAFDRETFTKDQS